MQPSASNLTFLAPYQTRFNVRHKQKCLRAEFSLGKRELLSRSKGSLVCVWAALVRFQESIVCTCALKRVIQQQRVYACCKIVNLSDLLFLVFFSQGKIKQKWIKWDFECMGNTFKLWVSLNWGAELRSSSLSEQTWWLLIGLWSMWELS